MKKCLVLLVLLGIIGFAALGEDHGSTVEGAYFQVGGILLVPGEEALVEGGRKVQEDPSESPSFSEGRTDYIGGIREAKRLEKEISESQKEIDESNLKGKLALIEWGIYSLIPVFGMVPAEDAKDRFEQAVNKEADARKRLQNAYRRRYRDLE